MIKTKDRIIYYILALLILLSSIITMLLDPQDTPTTNKQKNADIPIEYKINATPLKSYKQGSIDSH